MPYSVSSNFQSKCFDENPSIIKKFTIGSSDYTSYVTKWPSISRKWDDVRTKNVTISLANEDQTFNFFRTDKTKLMSSCELKFGFTTETSRQWGGFKTTSDGVVLNVVSGSQLDKIPSSNFTFEAICIPTSNMAGHSQLAKYIGKTGGDYLGIGIVGDVSSLSRRTAMTIVDTGFNVKYVYDPTTATINNEYHVVGVYNYTNSYYALYVNGTLVSSMARSNVSSALFVSGENYYIGADTIYGYYYRAPSIIDDVRLYDVALTNSDVSYNYANPATPIHTPAIWLGFNQVSSQTPINSGYVPCSISFVGTPTWENYGFGESQEYISLYTGTVQQITYDNGAVGLTLADKFKQLSDRVVGHSNSVMVFSSATMLPSDIAWTLCTCYGGLSDVQSTSNPDINYQNFLDWASVFSYDTVLMRARFGGIKVTEALRKLSRHTHSAIYIEQNKLSFNRFTAINTNVTSLDDRYILDTKLEIKDDDIVNKQWVYASYEASSNYWTISCFDASTTSINSFGLREQIEKDESVWYVNSANALNFAQRIMYTSGLPYDRLEVDTVLAPLPRLVGETISIVDSHLGISTSWRIMEQKVDMDTGKINLRIDGSQVSTPFLLDYSILDGFDVLL